MSFFFSLMQLLPKFLESFVYKPYDNRHIILLFLYYSISIFFFHFFTSSLAKVQNSPFSKIKINSDQRFLKLMINFEKSLF